MIEGIVALIASSIMYGFGTVHAGSLAIPGINGYVADLGWLFPVSAPSSSSPPAMR